MKKDKTLLRFRIYDGDKEYTDYCIISNEQLLEYTHREIISKFFYDNDVSKEQFLSDGRAVRIESEILLTNDEAEKLEKLGVAFLHNFELEQME
jgi:hypothetical protein